MNGWTVLYTHPFSFFTCLNQGFNMVLHHFQCIWHEGKGPLPRQSATALHLHQAWAARYPSICLGVRCTSKNTITERSITQSYVVCTWSTDIFQSDLNHFGKVTAKIHKGFDKALKTSPNVCSKNPTQVGTIYFNIIKLTSIQLLLI